MELSDLTAAVLSRARRSGAAVDDPGHGCEGGWIYDGEEARPCPTCAGEERKARLQIALKASGVGTRYFDVTWADLEMVAPFPTLKEAAGKIGEIIGLGHNAMFSGPPGSGKTQAATLLVKAALEAGYSAAVENVGRAAMVVRAAYDSGGDSEAALVERLSSVDLLVLDDIGAGEAGEGKLERRILYFVTEARQNARRPTILTTNLTGKEVATLLEQRVVNRLMPLEAFQFTHGKNFRTPKGGTAWTSS